MPAFNSVMVIGAGAWGTALAAVAARAGRNVVLFARNAAAVAEIAASRRNGRLAGVDLDPRIAITSHLAEAGRADIVLLAVPAQNSRGAMLALASYLVPATPVIACAKGI